MEFSHKYSILQSKAIQRLQDFVQEWRTQTAEEMPGFEEIEQKMHEHILALERELLAEELVRYDVTATEIEIDQVSYQRGLSSPETYLTTAGPVTVTRSLYRSEQGVSQTIRPLELRVGIVAGYWTPRAARQAAFAMAHLPAGDCEVLFAELGGMQPSRPSLDRLPKALSPHWEAQRQSWEALLRAQEAVAPQAAVVAISVDGVTLRMKAPTPQDPRTQPGKHASGPAGQREAGCGTVVVYDTQGERRQTVRYARMPERRKVTLQQQLETEVVSLLTLRPDLRRVLLADGAKPNWHMLAAIDQACGPSPQPSISIVDFYHACDHLKEACDANWGESTPASQAAFARLKTTLKKANQGVDRVIRVLTYYHRRASGRKQKRLQIQLTYFRNQHQRMRYAEYLCAKLPIASGVIEASCKTLVTQRMKLSGMTWTATGGQAILTLRSLIQSNRWRPAWELLQNSFRKPIRVCVPQSSRPTQVGQERSHHQQPNIVSNRVPDYAGLPLAQ
jgi:hypothetical protein